jgi:hypothetical protein
MSMRAFAEQRGAMPGVTGTMAVAEPERPSSSLGLELVPTWISPLFYADLIGLMTYVAVVAGPPPWFELPFREGAPAGNRHGDPPRPGFRRKDREALRRR